jgi:hypothetical protein
MTTADAARASGISTSPSLEHLYEEVERLHLTPGWISTQKADSLVGAEPDVCSCALELYAAKGQPR